MGDHWKFTLSEKARVCRRARACKLPSVNYCYISPRPQISIKHYSIPKFSPKSLLIITIIMSYQTQRMEALPNSGSQVHPSSKPLYPEPYAAPEADTSFETTITILSATLHFQKSLQVEKTTIRNLHILVNQLHFKIQDLEVQNKGKDTRIRELETTNEDLVFAANITRFDQHMEDASVSFY